MVCLPQLELRARVHVSLRCTHGQRWPLCWRAQCQLFSSITDSRLTAANSPLSACAGLSEVYQRPEVAALLLACASAAAACPTEQRRPKLFASVPAAFTVGDASMNQAAKPDFPKLSGALSSLPPVAEMATARNLQVRAHLWRLWLHVSNAVREQALDIIACSTALLAPAEHVKIGNAGAAVRRGVWTCALGVGHQQKQHFPAGG